jgi:hypothetical protein
MFNERRNSPRYNFNRYARVQAEASGPTRDCLIVNMSDDGVRLHCEIADGLGDFTLVMSDTKPPRRACRVVWRIGFEIGARFVDAERETPRAAATASAA